MTVTGTLPHAPEEWRVINWRHVCRGVRRLQMRIAEAMRAGRPGKAHALRRILTRSLAAACWAVRKVTENQGRKTPGIDGIVWSTPESRHVCSKRTFAAVDSYVMRVLWNWAKRRHPGKPRRWIKQRYFQTKAGKDWVFTGTDDHHRELILFKAANVPIQRHVKIRGNANPYDPTQEGYFEKRLAQKWAAGHYGHTRTKGLWLAQNGKCPRCRQLITEETEWHIHHKIPRLEGGPDTMDNLVLLHPTCHRQLHAQKTTP